MPDSTIGPSAHRQRSFSPASPQLKHAGNFDRTQTHNHPQRPNLSHQAPLSPPSSTSPSNVDASASPSPRVSILTPLSAPMSAELSQQSFTTQTAPQDDPQSATDNSQSSPQTASIPHSIWDSSHSPLPSQLNRPEKHRLDVAGNEELGSDKESNKRRRTDHEREGNLGPSAPSHVTASSSLSHSQPQSYYKFLNQTHSTSRPHASQNLFALYGLEDVAASVARTDPNTGEKINKLRKSYEGKVKELAGRNKAVNKPGELLGLVHYPDEEWQIQKAMGKEISADFSDDFLARLSNATKLGPGKLPAEEDAKWRNSLGWDDIAWKPVTNAAASLQQPANKTPLGQSASPATAAEEHLRPKRRGTKRRYDDDSFEGYGEGFVDDEGNVFSNEGEDDGRAHPGIRRKRRKDSSSASFSDPTSNSVGNHGGSIPAGVYRPSSPQKQPSSASLSVGVGSYGGR